MKKTSIASAVAIGMITLATGAYALAAERSPAPNSVVRTNGSDITLMPGSNTLRLHFSGAEIITRESSGGLMIVKAKGQLLHYQPDAYQLINGEIKPVDVHFQIDGIDRVIVQFGNIDKNAPVILKQGAGLYGQPVSM